MQISVILGGLAMVGVPCLHLWSLHLGGLSKIAGTLMIIRLLLLLLLLMVRATICSVFITCQLLSNALYMQFSATP